MTTLYEQLLQHEEEHKIELADLSKVLLPEPHLTIEKQKVKSLKQRLEETLNEEPFSTNPFIQKLPEEPLVSQFVRELYWVDRFGTRLFSEQRERYNALLDQMAEIVPEAKGLKLGKIPGSTISRLYVGFSAVFIPLILYESSLKPPTTADMMMLGINAALYAGCAVTFTYNHFINTTKSIFEKSRYIDDVYSDRNPLISPRTTGERLRRESAERIAALRTQS